MKQGHHRDHEKSNQAFIEGDRRRRQVQRKHVFAEYPDGCIKQSSEDREQHAQ
jgi:hypothetical protein